MHIFPQFITTSSALNFLMLHVTISNLQHNPYSNKTEFKSLWMIIIDQTHTCYMEMSPNKTFKLNLENHTTIQNVISPAFWILPSLIKMSKNLCSIKLPQLLNWNTWNYKIITLKNKTHCSYPFYCNAYFLFLKFYY